MDTERLSRTQPRCGSDQSISSCITLSLRRPNCIGAHETIHQGSINNVKQQRGQREERRIMAIFRGPQCDSRLFILWLPPFVLSLLFQFFHCLYLHSFFLPGLILFRFTNLSFLSLNYILSFCFILDQSLQNSDRTPLI